MAEAVNHPHLRERGTVAMVNDPVYGSLDLPASPLRFSLFPALNLRAPMLGEHNTEILQTHLGYSADRIGELESQGIIHRENR